MKIDISTEYKIRYDDSFALLHNVFTKEVVVSKLFTIKNITEDDDSGTKVPVILIENLYSNSLATVNLNEWIILPVKYEKMYIDVNKRAFFVTFSSTKQWKKRFSYRNINIYCPFTNTLKRDGTKALLSSLLIPVSYTSFYEALRLLREGRYESISIHKYFAVVNKPVYNKIFIYYKDAPVGIVTDTNIILLSKYAKSIYRQLSTIAECVING